ncbi:MAG TPA: phosphate ABC transporter substrate-binding protein PstS family protein [Solimonas sp.]
MSSPLFRTLVRALLAVSLLWPIASLAVPAAQDDLPVYRPVDGIAGTLSSIGSDSLNNLMTLWAEAFRRHYPSVNIQIQGAGSNTAPPALIEATASFGPMSRPMKAQEIQAFEQKYGYPPTPVAVGIDALALFVHQDNPIERLTMDQVDALFSPNLRCGSARPVRHWGDLGLGGEWAARSVQMFGRNSASGTYGYFKEQALCHGDFRNRVNEQPGSASVVQSVATTLTGIGYSGLGYRTAGVKLVKLARPGQAPVMPSVESALDGRYPLARLLYVYVNKPPNRPLPRMEAEFLKLVLSREGQDLTRRDGYVPLTSERLQRERAKLGMSPAD